MIVFMSVSGEGPVIKHSPFIVFGQVKKSSRKKEQMQASGFNIPAYPPHSDPAISFPSPSSTHAVQCRRFPP